MDGEKLKYDKIRKIQANAIEHNTVALALPVYRALVSSTTAALIPSLTKYIDDETSRIGRPGANRIALSYITEVGVEKCVAIAVTTTVNNFHRPLSHQSVSFKIGCCIADEWSFMQEDQALVEHIQRYTHRGSVISRRHIFLRQQLQRVLGRPLQSVPQVVKISLGNIFLSFIERTPLISLQKDRDKGFIICASDAVRSALHTALKDSAAANPIILPSLTAAKAHADTIIRPQAGADYPLSTTTDGSLIHRACNTLNAVGYVICKDQLAFINELADCPHTTLGLPGHAAPEMPQYIDGMTDEQRHAVRVARSAVYAGRNIWKAKRTKLLSSLSILKHYGSSEIFLEVVADFRGRLYPDADIIAYQGEDWVRSLWHFAEGRAITTKEQGNWLYVHAANCYGLSRDPYESRIRFVSDRMEVWRTVVADPFQNIEVLEEASDPFRFLGAIRELCAYEAHGLGYISHIPVQIDASSQAIQIWAGIVGNEELLRSSNVLPVVTSEGEVCHDIYRSMAHSIHDDAMTDESPDAAHWRKYGIDRGVVKKAMMIIPYGGTYNAITRIIDAECFEVPFRARVWLCKRLWNDCRDTLHDLVKMQQRLSRAVSEQLRETTKETYEWESPCGVLVKQRYMKTKRRRIRNVQGQTLYSYKIETDKVDRRRHATAFPANFLHSLDASLLCYCISLMEEQGLRNIMPIHDCVGVPAADVGAVKSLLCLSYLWVIREGQRSAKELCNILKVGGDPAGPWYHGAIGPTLEPDGLSSYLFS